MKTKVLVVDDQEDNRRVCQDNLEMDDYDVLLAENGQEALEIVSTKKPDVLLLDVMMPVMSGWDVLKKMKADGSLKEIPVIMLTALSEPRDQTKALEMGASDFIIKPFDIDVMIARIGIHAELKKARDSLKKRNKELTTSLEQARHLAFLGFESSSVAHDLGNVIFQTRIEEILKKKIKNLRDNSDSEKAYMDCMKWVNVLETSNEELEAIVKGLAYLAAGKVLEKVKIDLSELIRLSIQLYSRRIAKESIELGFDLQQVFINCDVSLKRVVINLLKNAMDSLASDPAEEKEKKLKVSCGEKEKEAFFCIEDNGPGIPHDIQGLIFKGHTSKKDGQGLGLPGSQAIVERHDGRIEFFSEPGKGAVFSVFLPLA